MKAWTKRQRAAKDRAVRAYVTRFLKLFMEELRAILRRRFPEEKQRFPNIRGPCHSCAFNPATDTWEGADKTALNLWGALTKGSPFYCHEPLPRDASGDWYWDPSKARLCAGWAAIQNDPEAKSAAERAARRLGRPSDTVAQEIANRAYATEAECPR